VSGLAEDIAKVMTKVLTEIKKLSDDDLKAFLAGEGSLRYVPRGHQVKAPPAPLPPKTPPLPKPTVDEVRARLDSAASEDEATKYLTDLKLPFAEIKALAATLTVPTSARAGKGVIADIVKVKVTGRLTTEAIRRF
jgi:hypothetical protein